MFKISEANNQVFPINNTSQTATSDQRSGYFAITIVGTALTARIGCSTALSTFRPTLILQKAYLKLTFILIY